MKNITTVLRNAAYFFACVFSAVVGLCVLLIVQVGSRCDDSVQIFSDKDYIFAAIHVEKYRVLADSSGRNFSAEQFHAENPNCCEVIKTDATVMDRLLFRAPDITVRLIYKLREEHVQPNGYDYYESWVSFGQCGVRDHFGQHIRRNEIPAKFR